MCLRRRHAPRDEPKVELVLIVNGFGCEVSRVTFGSSRGA